MKSAITIHSGSGIDVVDCRIDFLGRSHVAERCHRCGRQLVNPATPYSVRRIYIASDDLGSRFITCARHRFQPRSWTERVQARVDVMGVRTIAIARRVLWGVQR